LWRVICCNYLHVCVSSCRQFMGVSHKGVPLLSILEIKANTSSQSSSAMQTAWLLAS
jgi:hypothetical protein